MNSSTATLRAIVSAADRSAACSGAISVRENAATVLEADGIALSYGRRGHAANVVLRDFSMQLAAGEVVAVLGPSGVGKSSLLRVLAGLQWADAGQVRVGGESLARPHPRVATVFQDPCLLPWLTLEENVGFGLGFKHQPRLDGASRRERIHAAIAEVDLQHALGRYPAQLSGGMAQRVALARALARQPEILLLDEPFSALDEITRSEMQTLLQQISARHQTAAVLVTHDIDEALILADRVLLLGGQPAGLIGQWRIDQPHPRDAVVPELMRVRVDIVQRLREARHANPAHVSASSVGSQRAGAQRQTPHLASLDS